MTSLIRQMWNRFRGRPPASDEIGLEGPLRSWDDARQNASSYADATIFNRVAASTRAVREGNARAERDGVLFDSEQVPSIMVEKLSQLIARRGRISVLDFGGSLGSTYYQCRELLDGTKIDRWMVVEQAHFVELGQREFEDACLTFADSIDTALREADITVALFSGVLQYLDDPFAPLEQLVSRSVTEFIIDRTPTHEGDSDIFAVQHVPEYVYGVPVTYPIRIFSLRLLLQNLNMRFGPVVAGPASFDGPMRLGKREISFKMFSPEPLKASSQ